jgi:hypothetical protein
MDQREQLAGGLRITRINGIKQGSHFARIVVPGAHLTFLQVAVVALRQPRPRSADGIRPALAPPCARNYFLDFSRVSCLIGGNENTNCS